MVRHILNVILLIALGIFIGKYRHEIIPKALLVRHIIEERFFPTAPCTEPIYYEIDSFSTKFNISREYFLSALTDAEKVWEEPLGLNLFTHTEESSFNNLKINLIYDYRQEATNKLSTLGIAVDNSKASYEELNQKLITLKAQYEKDKVSFNTQTASFNKRQKEYEEKVAYWNNRGGAPEATYNELQKEQNQLETELAELKKKQDRLNNTVDEINALVVTVNKLITSLNLSVEKYNTTSTARGESFEEGLYISDGIADKIEIYEFSNRTKLVRVLAHELGHALGLEHVSDPKAIMYERNENNSESLTLADLVALKRLCNIN